MPGIYYFRHRRVAKRSLHQNVFHQKQLYFDPSVSLSFSDAFLRSSKFSSESIIWIVIAGESRRIPSYRFTSYAVWHFTPILQLISYVWHLLITTVIASSLLSCLHDCGAVLMATSVVTAAAMAFFWSCLKCVLVAITWISQQCYPHRFFSVFCHYSH